MSKWHIIELIKCVEMYFTPMTHILRLWSWVLIRKGLKQSWSPDELRLLELEGDKWASLLSWIKFSGAEPAQVRLFLTLNSYFFFRLKKRTIFSLTSQQMPPGQLPKRSVSGPCHGVVNVLFSRLWLSSCCFSAAPLCDLLRFFCFSLNKWDCAWNIFMKQG